MRNLLSIHDFSLLVEKTRQGRLRDILMRMANRRGAARRSWENVVSPIKHWWDIPEVMERWNTMISGAPRVDYLAHFLGARFAGGESRRALSLGCGTGHRELDLARSGAFERIDGVDRSRTRIAYSRQMAHDAGFDATIHYIAGDAMTVELAEDAYDLILCEQFLHHMPRLEAMLSRVRAFMKPDGFFIFNEFVGPSRFQWTARQLDAVNLMLGELPERYRVRWKSGTIKRKIHRPGELAMMLYDPTEAVKSAMIIPLIRDMFDIVEIKGYGGSVLQLLFSDIAANFRSRDPETQGYIRRCFEFEDGLLRRGEIAHDFAAGLCRRR